MSNNNFAETKQPSLNSQAKDEKKAEAKTENQSDGRISYKDKVETSPTQINEADHYFLGRLNKKSQAVVLESQGGRIGVETALQRLGLADLEGEELTKKLDAIIEDINSERAKHNKYQTPTLEFAKLKLVVSEKLPPYSLQQEDVEDAISCTNLAKSYAHLPEKSIEEALQEAIAAEAKEYREIKDGGSTCHAVLVNSNKVTTANMGDGGVFIVEINENSAVTLTRSNKIIHDTKNQEERNRLDGVFEEFRKEKLQQHQEFKDPNSLKINKRLPRKNYLEAKGEISPTVNVTRGFGDSYALGHSEKPDIYHHTVDLSQGLSFVLAGCDGVFERAKSSAEQKVEKEIQNAISNWNNWYQEKLVKDPSYSKSLAFAELASRLDKLAHDGDSKDNRSIAIIPIGKNSNELVVLADGHGTDGKKIAESAAKNLPIKINNALNKKYDRLISNDKIFNEHAKELSSKKSFKEIYAYIDESGLTPSEINVYKGKLALYHLANLKKVYELQVKLEQTRKTKSDGLPIQASASTSPIISQTVQDLKQEEKKPTQSTPRESLLSESKLTQAENTISLSHQPVLSKPSMSNEDLARGMLETLKNIILSVDWKVGFSFSNTTLIGYNKKLPKHMLRICNLIDQKLSSINKTNSYFVDSLIEVQQCAYKAAHKTIKIFRDSTTQSAYTKMLEQFKASFEQLGITQERIEAKIRDTEAKIREAKGLPPSFSPLWTPVKDSPFNVHETSSPSSIPSLTKN